MAGGLETESLARGLEVANARLSGIALEGPYHSSFDAEIFIGHNDHLPYKLAVKKFNRASDARLAFRALSRMAGKSGSESAYRVPEPVGLYCDDKVLVTEWVEAPSFRVQFLDLRTPKKLIVDNARRAAEWLKWFHSVDAGALGHLDTLRKLRNGLVHLSRDDFPIHDRAIATARDLLFSTSHQLHHYPTANVLCHGDFKPENILVSDRTVVGIDFATRYRTSGDNDVVHFLNHTELLAYLPRGLRIYHIMPELIQTFLDGYYKDKEDHARYYWLRLHHYLRFWERYALKNKRSPVDRYHAFCLRRLIKAADRDLRAYMSAR